MLDNYKNAILNTLYKNIIEVYLEDYSDEFDPAFLIEVREENLDVLAFARFGFLDSKSSQIEMMRNIIGDFVYVSINDEPLGDRVLSDLESIERKSISIIYHSKESLSSDMENCHTDDDAIYDLGQEYVYLMVINSMIEEREKMNIEVS